MKKYLLLAFVSLAVSQSYSQIDLLINGSFETLNKKIKEGGMVTSSYGWTSPSAGKADIFSSSAKSPDYSIPKNMYGDGDAHDGQAYAGINVFTPKEEIPRQFLQSKLNQKMDEGKVYCVKMHVMLSMMSKYSSNNLGIYISEMAPTDKDLDSFYIQPQIIHSQNKIFDEMFEWTAICQSYIAKGGEEFITIGNFGKAETTQNEKVKKPKGVVGTQAKGAYYYIDDVSVLNMAGLESCDCELDPGGLAMQVVYSVGTSTEMEVDVPAKVEMTRIYFDELSAAISELAQSDLVEISTLLKDNVKYKVKVTGHTDPVEESKATGDVSLNRANAVKAELVKLGVPENRMLVVGVQDFEPVTKDASSAGQAQNRRVVFTVINK